MPSEATKAVRNFRDAQEPRRRYWQGWMIDFEGIGSSKVTEEPGKVYVRLDRGLSGEASGEIIKAYARIRPIAGWAVWVGTTPYRDWEYTVLDVDLEAMGGAIDGVPTLEPHHITHEWGAPSGSDDTVYSKFLQLYDFSVWPYGGLTVEIKGGQFDPSGTTQTLNQTVVDLSAYQPDHGCLYALICISPTGTIEVVPGQVADGFLDLIDIPPAPSNDHWEIAAVRLCAGVDTIVQTPRDTNITDLRFANMGWAGKRYGGHNPVTLDVNAADLMTLTDQEIGLQNQPSGTVYAAPTGGNGIPDFRFLYDSDIPDIHTHYPGSIPTSALEDPGGIGVTTFLELTDTPAAYAGGGDRVGQAPIINAGEDALEFTAVLLADGTIMGATAQAQDFGSNGIKTDEIQESTGAAGVLISDRAQFGAEVGLGTATVPHAGVGWAMLALEGPSGNAAGPHIQITTDSNDYPLLQVLAYQHDTIAIAFDAYYDGAWRSSDAGSSFRIYKQGDELSFDYDTAAAGGAVTWNTGILLTASGKVGIDTATVPHAGVGAAMLALDGADASADGPHVQFTTDANNYPTMQIRNWAHDDVEIAFDAYFSGGWKSSDAGSSFVLRKNADKFSLAYDVAAAGGAVTWNTALSINTSGEIGVGTAATANSFFYVYDATISTTATWYGYRGYFVKTAGATNYSNSILGVSSTINLNQSGGEIGGFYGAYLSSLLTLGTVGNADSGISSMWGAYLLADVNGGTVTASVLGAQTQANIQGGTVNSHVYGHYSYVNLDTGSVLGRIYAHRIDVDIAAGMTAVDDKVFGLYLKVDDQFGVADTVYGIYLNIATGVDWAIYSPNNVPSYHTGIFDAAGGVKTKYAVTNTDATPTSAQLVTAFGALATLGNGFIGVLNDADLGTNVWLCVVADEAWQIVQLAAAP